MRFRRVFPARWSEYGDGGSFVRSTSALSRLCTFPRQGGAWTLTPRGEMARSWRSWCFYKVQVLSATSKTTFLVLRLAGVQVQMLCSTPCSVASGAPSVWTVDMHSDPTPATPLLLSLFVRARNPQLLLWSTPYVLCHRVANSAFRQFAVHADLGQMLLWNARRKKRAPTTGWVQSGKYR